MTRKPTDGLTDAELRVMDVLWHTGGATVREVQDALAAHELAYTTVLTTIRVLEQKGHVTHTARGRAHVYQATNERHASRRGAIRQLVSKWFNDSPNELVLNLLEEADLTPAQLDEVMRRAKEKRK